MTVSVRALTLSPAVAAGFLCLFLPVALGVSMVSPLYVFAAGFVVVFGLVLAERDFCLGAAVAFVGLNALRDGTSVGLSVAGWFAAGSLLLVLIRVLPLDWMRLFAAAFVFLGLCEAVYAVLQATGVVAPWSPAPGGIPAPLVHGTLGAPRALGAVLALAAAMAPVWLLPVFLAGLFVSQSWLAAAALGVALGVRYRRHAVKLAVALLIAVLLLGAIYAARDGNTDTVSYRLEMWGAAIGDVVGHGPVAWVLGLGPGVWWIRMPTLEVARRPDLREIPRAAYNEPLQLFYEHGLIGLALLYGWLRRWRYAFVSDSPFAPALWALAVLSLGTFPFHLSQLAGPSILVVGGATREAHA